MKSFSFLLAAGLAVSVEANRLPLCSAVCLTDAIVATGCDAVSTDCICSSDVFMTSVNECVEKRCLEDDKLTTLESAEQFCSTTSMHSQLKKRGSWSNVDASGPKPWWGSGFFGGWFGGRRGRPHWGWSRPGRFGRPGRPSAPAAPAAPAPAPPKPVEWVPNFQAGTQEWWKQQSAEWWAQNGHEWWAANGWHFSGPQWYWGKTQQWWQNQGPRWWQGPSAPGAGRPGNWQGGRPWWPQAPAPTQPEPTKPTATPTTIPSDYQAWEDWESENPSSPTATSDPADGGWQGWTPVDPTSTATTTPTRPTWTPYTTTKPVQTVIPTGSGW